MLSFLALITGLAGPVSAIANKILDLQQSRITAASDKERQEIDASVQALHDRKDVLIAQAGNRVATILNASMALLMALGGMIFVNKILIWDKVIGSFYEGHPFSTDPLDANMWWVVMAGFGYYLLMRVTGK